MARRFTTQNGKRKPEMGEAAGFACQATVRRPVTINYLRSSIRVPRCLASHPTAPWPTVASPSPGSLISEEKLDSQQSQCRSWPHQPHFSASQRIASLRKSWTLLRSLAHSPIRLLLYAPQSRSSQPSTTGTSSSTSANPSSHPPSSDLCAHTTLSSISWPPFLLFSPRCH